MPVPMPLRRQYAEIARAREIAEILIKNKRFEEADSLLADVVSIYPWDILADNALFLRAQLHELQFENNEQAMELYQLLLLEYPGSLFAVESRKRFRELRGDVVN